MAASKLEIIIDGKADGATKALKSTDSALGTLGKSLGSVAAIASGFVLGAGILKLPGLLSDMVSSAIEDEQATIRLNQSLMNLGGNFDQHVAKVNQAIAAGQKLAFSDDQVRDSFQFLAAATGSVDEALLRQKSAMDLARGANIDLSLASKMLGKLTDENIQVFKKLGITMAENATEADVLAAVQAKFGGQADAYAKSTKGQMEQAKLAISEAKEAIGGALLPVVGELAKVAADKLPILQEMIGLAASRVSNLLTPAFRLAVSTVRDALVPAFATLRSTAEKVWESVNDLYTLLTTNDLGAAKTAFDDLGKVIGDDFNGNVLTATQSLRGFKQTLEDPTDTESLGATLTKLFGPDVTFKIAQQTGAVGTFGDEMGRMLGKIDPSQVALVGGLGVAIFKLGPAAAGAAVALAPFILVIAGIVATYMQIQLAFAGVQKGMELWPVFAAMVAVASAAIVAAVTPMTTRVTGELSKYWTEIEPKFGAAWGAISSTVVRETGAIISFLQPALAVIQAFWASSWDAIAAVLRGTLELIGSAILVWWVQVSGYFSAALSALGGDWAGAWERMRQTLREFHTATLGMTTQFWQMVKNLFQIGTAFVKSLWDIFLLALKLAWDLISADITASLTAWWEGVVATWEVGVAAVGDAWTALWENAKQTLINAASAIIELARTLINNLISLINRGIGAINGGLQAAAGAANAFMADTEAAINGAIRFANATLGMNAPMIELPRVHPPVIGTIPHLAMGGLISQAGAALVGERGPEIVHLPKGAAVQPLGSGAPSVVINIHGSLIAERDLERTMNERLTALWRRQGLGFQAA